MQILEYSNFSWYGLQTLKTSENKKRILLVTRFTIKGIDYKGSCMYPSSAKDETRCEILLKMPCEHSCTVVRVPCTQGWLLVRMPSTLLQEFTTKISFFLKFCGFHYKNLVRCQQSLPNQAFSREQQWWSHTTLRERVLFATYCSILNLSSKKFNH